VGTGGVLLVAADDSVAEFVSDDFAGYLAEENCRARGRRLHCGRSLAATWPKTSLRTSRPKTSAGFMAEDFAADFVADFLAHDVFSPDDFTAELVIEGFAASWPMTSLRTSWPIELARATDPPRAFAMSMCFRRRRRRSQRCCRARRREPVRAFHRAERHRELGLARSRCSSPVSRPRGHTRSSDGGALLPRFGLCPRGHWRCASRRLTDGFAADFVAPNAPGWLAEVRTSCPRTLRTSCPRTSRTSWPKSSRRTSWPMTAS
jgi:hypothetical protein